MIRGQRHLLKPTPAQELLLRKAAGVSRFVWNWALAIRNTHTRLFRNRPNYNPLGAFQLQKHWNKIKGKRYPWAKEVSKHGPENVILGLEKAFLKYARRVADYPKFKKKDKAPLAFCAGRNPGDFRFIGKRVHIPKIGYIKVTSIPRWSNGRLVEGRIKHRAGRWWLSLTWELPDPLPLPPGRPKCGIDLGLNTFATIYSGGKIQEKILSPKPYAKAKRKIRLASKRLSRRVVGSKRREKAKIRLGRIHERIRNIRDNFLHQTTTRLVNQYGFLVLEDLAVDLFLRGRLAGSFIDVAMGKFRYQIRYKATTAGSLFFVVNRLFPSSKRCSNCGAIRGKLSLSERVFSCHNCEFTVCRDENAAINLERVPVDDGEFTLAETDKQASRKATRRRSKKRECLELPT